jgi:hypothetical protein
MPFNHGPDVCTCEGFRMPAASDDAASSGGRRTKTSKGGNRDLGALAGPRRAAILSYGDLSCGRTALMGRRHAA